MTNTDKKIILLDGSYSAGPKELDIKDFASWLDTNDLSKIEDKEIEEVLDAIGRLHNKISRERSHSDRHTIKKYETALLSIQRIAMRMTAFKGGSINELKTEIDRIIKGVRIYERR